MMSGATEERLREYLNRVTADLRTTRHRVRELEDQQLEPVAIVSMSCRYPGGADTPEKYWDLVAAGADLVGELPTDRGWDLAGLYHPDPDHPGTSYTRHGAFLRDAAGFDAGFFGISPREALAMDPQQRLLLETAWEVFERAGIDVESLRGERAGVFVGASNQGYGTSLRTTPEGVEGHLLTGGSGAVLSGRIAYTLGFEGPAVTVDTMCSSSLVALHLAVQALRSGECTLALAAGATVMGTPRNFIEFSRQSGLAVDGRCKSFSDDADGTGWGEGVNVLLLERLSDARRNGHQVLAVVRGSATNQDGASNGLTAPHGPSQQRVIRQALANAGVQPAEVDAVEAHGTGTALGDPIEAQALLATYGQGRGDGDPLWLGSVKSNIGHTQAASGIAGVMKMVSAMRHGILPRSLHVGTPSSYVDWSSGAVELLTGTREWPRTDRPRRAGVSSFGASGTNAHVILEQAPEADPADEGTQPHPRSVPVPVVPWVISARTPAALPAQAARLLSAVDHLSGADVGLSLATTRAALEHRAVVLGTDPDGLRTGLRALADGALPAPGVVSGVAGDGLTAFVFSGQGSQRAGMGRELAAAYPVFDAALSDVCDHFDRLLELPLREVMFHDPDGLLRDTGWAQPALFAVEVALFRLVESWGVRPDCLVGHSVGELAAAHVAGALSLADACRLVAARAELMQALPQGGAMWAVRASAAEVAPLLTEGVSVAAVNAPGQLVLSGSRVAVESVAAALPGRENRWLEVSHAFHSVLMDPMLKRFGEAAAGIGTGRPQIPVVSTLTGEPVQEFTARYWADQVRGTVRFADAVTGARALGVTRFLELGPAGSLLGAIGETCDDEALAVALLHRDTPEPRTSVTALARLWTDGCPVDWHRFHAPSGAAATPLPTYAFQREHYWLTDPDTGSAHEPDPADAAFWATLGSGDTSAVARALRVSEDAPLSAVLPALTHWRAQQRDRSTLDSWRYRVDWVPATGRTPARLTGHWLLLTSADRAPGDGTYGEGTPGDGKSGCESGYEKSGHEAAELIGHALRQQGATVTELTLTADLDRAGIAALLSGHPDAAGAVSLLALDERPHPAHPALTTGLALNLLLAQALTDQDTPVPLWLCTQDAVPAGGDDRVSSPGQSPTWGLGLGMGLEHPDHWGGLIDLPTAVGPGDAGQLAAVLAADDGEDQTAIRAGATLLRRLRRAPAPQDDGRQWRTSGAALITGGTGGLGAHTARWLAQAGAEHLVLTSRRGPDAPGARELAAELTALGPRVTVVACDVTDHAALARLVADVQGDGPRIRTVVHSAGVGELAPLAGTDLDAFAAGAHVKLAGTANLDRLFDRADLDAFVLYSSVAALWGAADHGAYAAGNAYLDAVTRSRRARGLAGTTLAWGIWSADGGGMAKDVVSTELKWRGLPFMDPDLAIAGLRQAVTDDEAFLAVADVDWEQFVPAFTAARPRPLLDTVPEVRAVLDREKRTDAPANDAHSAAGALREQLRPLSAQDRSSALRDLVRTHVAAVLGHRTPDGIDDGRPFRDLGFDSLLAVTLRNALHAATGLKLTTTLVFDYPSVTRLAAHLGTVLFGDARPPAPAPAVTTGASDDDAIAIVGMGCRFPGEVTGPEDLWRLMSAGEDAIGPFPDDRGWNLDQLYSPDPDEAGKTYVRTGGFVRDAGRFDASFFGISPREALAMDPQQRLLLETSWEAIEHGRIDPHSLRGSECGVFVGAAHSGYGASLRHLPEGVEGHLVTGTVTSVASGRISYTLGLEGPAVTLDTGCSSALVALHLAVRSLRSGECSLALAGAASVISAPIGFLGFSRQRGLAADGRCKAFSEDADGMGFAEGAGMVLLERLSDARRNGHRVLALVRGSATNQDGASNGLTAPNGPSQQRVIQQALADAGLSPADVDAVEAHGTGTPLGDPIEAQALLATYGQGRADRADGEPLWLGSVKSNIGHTQVAAGAAGLIKMVLAMRHELLPKSLHAEARSSYVDWSAGAVELLTEERAWPRTVRPRRAGVSSFGVSGTNAHVILEEAPEPPVEAIEAVEAVESGDPVATDPEAVVPWVMSGRSAGALREQASTLAGSAEGADRADVGWSLVRTRSSFEHRAVVVGELGEGLSAVAGGVPGAGVVSGVAGPVGRPVFVFPGQGAQWVGMAVELLGSSSVFAGRLAECERVLSGFVDWSLVDVLRGVVGAPSLERVDVVQPVSFAVMVSLAALWESFGVVPSVVVGHSQGEIAAACVAGVLSLEDAARVVCVRSAAIGAVAGRGGMVSVGASVAVVEGLLERWDGRVSVAAVNGPSQVVVSGERAALDEFVGVCEGLGVRARRVAVDYASHSAAMEELRERLAAELSGVSPRAGRVPVVSSVSGGYVDPLTMDGGYWFTNLRERVRFADAVECLAEDGFGVFVEVSSHPVLTGAVEELLEARGGGQGVVAGSLRRGEGGTERFLTSVAELWVRGAEVDWSAAFHGTRPHVVDLPTYPFQRQHYWLEEQAAPALPASDPVDAEFWAAVEGDDPAALAATLGIDDDQDRLGSLQPVLADWRHRRKQTAVLDSWRYGISWQPVTDGTGSHISRISRIDGSRWLLLVPAGLAEGASAWASEAGQGLERQGAHVRFVEVEGADRTELTGRLRDAAADGCTGVLSLLALDERDVRQEHRSDGPSHVNTAVAVIQALGDAGITAPLWCATRGAVSVGRSDRSVDPGHALLWGLGRIAALEYPQRIGGLVDLPATPDDRAVERLVAAVTGREGEDQLAVRPNGLYVRRLIRKPLSDTSAVRSWRPTGTVLVTGGTGGIGAEIAAWLAGNGARHLLLTSRRGEQAPGAKELKARLTALGAEVTVAACDVADREALALLLESVPDEQPLTAVVHAAAVLDDCLLDALTPERAATVLRPKVDAARHLHELTQDADLDAFVLFSSLAGTLGGPGQASYAAANAYLDALAVARRSQGLPATSLAWGVWGEVGLASGELGERLRSTGMGQMAPELALTVLQQALDQDLTCLAVTDVDWQRYGPTCTEGRSGRVLDSLPEARATAPGATPSGADTGSRPVGEPSDAGFAGTLAGHAPLEREQALVALVRTQAAAALGLPGPDAVDPDRALRDLGFDSLTAVDLRNRLNAVTGLRLPVTVVFDHATAARLARHLDTELFGAASTAPHPESPLQLTATATDLTDDPVAIVAMSCRLPGGISTPEEYWDLLAEGRDAVSALPADRGWDIERLYDPDPDRPGTFYTRGGGFLHDAGRFDPLFFGISPRVAPAIDPQQRLLLETAWEAFERAGIDPAAVKGSPVGVFVGSNYNDYGSRLRSAPGEYEGQLATGSAASVASGRVAYTFGLEGPAVTVDTACSSSLVALNLAAQAVRSGECTMALAGGVTVISTPDTFIEFSRQGALSPDGRCKAFSAGADGAGWAEGVGMLLVERLSEARRHGHPVVGIIRGAAVNQDGASNGLTAPSGPAQQRVIRQALANGGLTASDVDMVEAHGTGTKLGDPIEAEALLATYGKDRPADRPLWLGSVKSNIGHTQAASGVAGVIKAVLAIQRGTMPRTLHAAEPSPHIDWSTGTVRLLTEERPWPGGDTPHRVGVSSFGVSGTNAHVIIEQAPPAETAADQAAPFAGPSTDPPAELSDAPHAASPQAGPPAPEPVRGPTAGLLPWTLSARTATALTAQAENLLAAVEGRPGAEAVDIAHTLAGRARFDHRLVLWGADRAELRARLTAWLPGDGRPATPSAAGVVSGGRTAFLFSGQGAQRPGMGGELYRTFKVYADAFDQVCAHVDLELERPLRDVVFADPDGPDAALLDRTDYTQPALFAVEVALYRLYESWGVTPDYLVGHSIGELSAAHLAGVFTLADACRLVVARGRLMQELPSAGAMVAVAAAEDEVLPLLAGRADRIALAALNGPAATVVSGEPDEVARVADHFTRLGRKTRQLRVSHAFHSPQMDAMLERFAEIVRGIPMAPPTLPVVSGVTGERATAEQLCTPEYWASQLREPVRFADAVGFLTREGVSRFLEVGPDAVLAAMAVDCRADDAPGVVVPAVRRGRDEAGSVIAAAAQLYVHGAPCDWSAFCPDGRLTELPTYPFDRQRYWLDAPGPDGDVTSAGLGRDGHPLLDAVLQLADGEGLLFTSLLSVQRHPWLADHVIDGATVLPGTAFVELAVRAGDRAGCGQIGELTLQAPLVLPERGAVQVQIRMGAEDTAGARTLTVHSRPAGAPDGEPWQQHATGTLLSDARADVPTGVPVGEPAPDQWPPAEASPVELGDFYAALAEVSADYGPAFQGLRAAWRHGSEVFAEVSLPEGVDVTGYGLHPALFDAALHTIGLGAAGDRGQGVMPFSWRGVVLHTSGATRLRVRLRDTAENTVSVQVWDPSGRPVASVDSLAIRPTAGARPHRTAAPLETLFRTEWREIPAAPLPTGPDWALIGSPDGWPGLDGPLARAGTPGAYPTIAALSEAVRAGGTVPDRVVVSATPAADTPAATPTTATPAAGESARAVRAACHRALALVKEWLADDRFAASRLVFVTRGAVAADPGADLTDLPGAAVHGLIRAAASEHPGRFALVDTDASEESAAALPLAVASGEPQLVVREGRVRAARLARVPAAADRTEPVWDSYGTTLVTGATGTLGRLVARHLVTTHGVRRLLLLSRSGPAADGAAELRAELTALGAEVTVAACDAADRTALSALLDTVPDAHPLTAVVHAAGVVDDGLITALTPERIDGVLAPKVDAALNLHELTASRPVSAFVLFSSLASTFGGAGQAGYAAGNAFLDALAARRRAQGLPAVALCWGPWAELSTMTGGLAASDHARFARGGVTPLSSDDGLALLDTACARDEAVLVPARISVTGFAGPHEVPALLRGLVRGRARPAVVAPVPERPTGSADRLGAMSAAERARALLELVRAEAARVLAYAGPELVDAERGFLEMGFDSLSAIELRNRLGKETGLTLPATLLFDYPTPAALVAYLGEIFPSEAERVLGPILDELAKLAANLPEVTAADELRGRVESRLRELLSEVASEDTADTVTSMAVDDLESATDEEIFQFLDNQLDT
ncbi:type I polyketide synthase [Streptomyces sp. NPDC090053]|uniref:type I polyketide synthase n=1 Tax=Streptomyces sp. NPDC090053 TaxID=3365932 RepID=UPI0038004662